MTARWVTALMLALLALPAAACAAGGDRDRGAPAAGSTTAPEPGTASASPPATTPTGPGRATPATPATPVAPARPAGPDTAAMVATVRALAERIGPREATSAAYRRGAALVDTRLRALGYSVRRQTLRVPAGNSWGVPVRAGRTENVIAEPPGFDPRRPHLLVGAHLDTVPQAPGAEDNASGVAVLLELGRLVGPAAPAGAAVLPTVLVAFGAEEPRGPGDDRHHYGSRAYVAAMDQAARRALAGMISLDRVGVGSRVPVCTGGPSPQTVANALAATAQRLGVQVRRCYDNRSSDHWSFERAGLTAARVGSTPYAEYHSARDRVGVVRAAQLGRVARVVADTLRTPLPR